VGEFAVLDKGAAAALIAAGYKLEGIKKGSYTTVHYFNDSNKLQEFLEKYLTNK
jgi:hypothetical protein